MTKIALLGGNGMIATRLTHYLSKNAGFQLFPLSHQQADVTNPEAMEKALAAIKPDWVINCSAYLNADRCENNPKDSYAVNFKGGLNAAEVARHLGAKFIQFSTDYVFDGKTEGYSETDVPLPLNYYGLHKYMADIAILGMKSNAYVFRTASIYGSGLGKNDIVQAFLKQLARRALGKPNLVSDMRISITTPMFLSRVVQRFIENPPATGLYNTVAAGSTSWLEATKQAFLDLGIDLEFNAVENDNMVRVAARPLYSWLKTDKLAALMPVPTWQEALAEQMAELKDDYLGLLKVANEA
jgi:dTDP-4-dehydrorhamnose reductase